MKSMINIIIAAFAFAIAFGIAILTGNDLVKHAVLLAFVINWIAYVPAYLLQTEKFYDLTGTITYLTVIWTTYVLSSSKLSSVPIGNLILVLLISFWAARLGSFLFMRIHKDGEDKRFRTIKKSPTQFFMTFNLSALWVVICSLCALTAVSNGVLAVEPIFYLGLFIFIAGFSIEVIADNQKTKFRAIPENANKFITTGLWSASRHPNYFGEVVLWAGIAIMSFPYLEGVQYWTLISPIFSFVLIYFVSGVRMLEARANVKWGENAEYQKYVKKTPVFFPKIF